MLVNDLESIQYLNLLRTQSSFVYHEDSQTDRITCESLKLIPIARGVYWVAGVTVTNCDWEVESVFRVDTDSGGTLVSTYWWIDGKWYKQDNNDALNALRLSVEEVYPYDWRFAVPLEEDIFHPSDATN